MTWTLHYNKFSIAFKINNYFYENNILKTLETLKIES